jgi:hypothetical protein
MAGGTTTLVTVMVATAALEESATEVAVSVIVSDDGAVTGAV